MVNETFYVVEVIRKADNKTFMLFGHHSEDPNDSWYFDLRGGSELAQWARLPTITRFGDHMDHNQWIVDFVIPEMRKLGERYPLDANDHPEGYRSGTHFLNVYKVDLRASLNLRFKPMVCQNFHLSGEPFVGAIKQGYSRG
jgi:hypothetical protein